jgi:hypothetical protein
MVGSDFTRKQLDGMQAWCINSDNINFRLITDALINAKVKKIISLIFYKNV